MIYFVIMYTSYTILALNIMFIFEFASKLTVTSFKFFTSLFKTSFVNLVQIILVKLRLNHFLCFCTITYLIIFLWLYFIICTVKISFVLLLSLNFIFAVSLPRSLVGLILAYLEPKSSRTLHSCGELPGPWIIHVCLDLFFG